MFIEDLCESKDTLFGEIEVLGTSHSAIVFVLGRNMAEVDFIVEDWEAISDPSVGPKDKIHMYRKFYSDFYI